MKGKRHPTAKGERTNETDRQKEGTVPTKQTDRKRGQHQENRQKEGTVPTKQRKRGDSTNKTGRWNSINNTVRKRGQYQQNRERESTNNNKTERQKEVS